MTKKQFYKTLPQKAIHTVKPNDYMEEINRDAAKKSHDRTQLLENAKTDVIRMIIISTPYIFIFLVIIWGLCVIYNQPEIKNGTEIAMGTILSLIFGSLLGKYVF